MKKQKTIYIVTSGDYSDYQTHCVFSTEKMAEDFIKFEKDNNEYYHYNYEIEEHDLDIPKDKWTVIATIVMNKNGDTTYSDISTQIGKLYLTKKFFHNCLHIDIKSDSVERAIKVVNEKRMQMLANNEWGNKEALKKY